MDKSAFTNYWSRKKLLSQEAPHFPVRSWIWSDDLCDIEHVYLEALKNKHSILDIGAGDLRVQKKMIKHGFKGEYHTQDVGDEYSYTYKSLDEIHRTYDAIICFDVIEHMSFAEGMNLLSKIDSLLKPGGVVLLQTPNARCIRHPLSWDMTHLHCYNLPDLWALFRSQNYQCQGYRVVFLNPPSFKGLLYKYVGRFIITRLLGADYADNIALIATKGGHL